MKPKILFVALCCAWQAGGAHAALVDDLWSQYNTAVNGAGGLNTKMQSASQATGTCDVPCKTGRFLTSMPPPQDSSKMGTVSAIFEQLIGRTITLSLYNPSNGIVTSQALLTPYSSTAATLSWRVLAKSKPSAAYVVDSGPVSYMGQTQYYWKTSTTISNQDATVSQNYGSTTASIGTLALTVGGFNYSWGSSYFDSCSNPVTYTGVTSINTDRLLAGGTSAQSAWTSSSIYCGASCFPAGTLVMMADGSLRTIERVAVGDWLMGAHGQAVQVQDVDRPVLGDRRMMAMEDGSLYWSEEHAMWTCDEQGAQWWWAANPDRWRWEASIGHMGGLRDNSTLRGGEGFAFAHLEGWKTHRVRHVEQFGPGTQLYLPRTNGVPIIVNGYVVGAGVNQAAFEYQTFDWNVARHDVLREHLPVAA